MNVRSVLAHELPSPRFQWRKKLFQKPKKEIFKLRNVKKSNPSTYMALWLRWHSESSILGSGLGPRGIPLPTGLGASSSGSSWIELSSFSPRPDAEAAWEEEDEDKGTGAPPLPGRR